MTIQLLRTPGPTEHRTPAQLYEQYEVEKELASRLRKASRIDRRKLYSAAYEELFRRIPHHTQLRKKESSSERAASVALQLQLLRRFLTPDASFLEVGAGGCALSLAVAGMVRRVYALDVSATITRADEVPANFQLILSDGTSIPVPEGSISVAYSNQLMEHLHPDDALEQLGNIYRALAPGGVYVCITPSRLTGPHDISRYFDFVATGFHLKEYTIAELTTLFHKVGFRNINQYTRRRGVYTRMPGTLVRAIEMPVAALPARVRNRIARSSLVRGLLEIRLVARK